MSVQFPPIVKSQVQDQCNHYRARCWRIELRQLTGRVLRFTDHAEPLTLFDEAQYQASPPMEGGAFDRQDVIGTATTELSGVISDDGVSMADLRAGIYRGALVTEYVVDTRLAFAAPIDMRQFFIRTTQFEGSNFSFNCESIASDFNVASGEMWGPMCRVALFSSGRGKCNALPGTYLNDVTVSSVFDDITFEVSNTNALWDTAQYGDDGTVDMKSGVNAGFQGAIKRHTINTPGFSIIEMQLKPPNPLVFGDVIVLSPGCNKQLGGITEDPLKPHGDCFWKFQNVINFQGEPWTPTTNRSKGGIEY